VEPLGVTLSTEGDILARASLFGLLLCVPGTEVPRATKAMALTESLRKMKHPKCPATSPMTAVHTPIMAMEITKQG